MKSNMFCLGQFGSWLWVKKIYRKRFLGFLNFVGFFFSSKTLVNFVQIDLKNCFLNYASLLCGQSNKNRK